MHEEIGVGVLIRFVIKKHQIMLMIRFFCVHANNLTLFPSSLFLLVHLMNTPYR